MKAEIIINANLDSDEEDRIARKILDATSQALRDEDFDKPNGELSVAVRTIYGKTTKCFEIEMKPESTTPRA